MHKYVHKFRWISQRKRKQTYSAFLVRANNPSFDPSAVSPPTSPGPATAGIYTGFILRNCFTGSTRARIAVFTNPRLKDVGKGTPVNGHCAIVATGSIDG